MTNSAPQILELGQSHVQQPVGRSGSRLVVGETKTGRKGKQKLEITNLVKTSNVQHVLAK